MTSAAMAAAAASRRAAAAPGGAARSAQTPSSSALQRGIAVAGAGAQRQQLQGGSEDEELPAEALLKLRLVREQRYETMGIVLCHRGQKGYAMNTTRLGMTGAGRVL